MTPAPAASLVPVYNTLINDIEADGNTGDTTMQQAIYNSINSNGISIQAANTGAPKASGLRRWVARRWDMVGVLALMGSSAAYGVFALAHVGL